MMKERILVFLAFALVFVATSLGFSQTNSNGTTSTSTSTNTVNATVFATGGGQASAMPGVMGTPGVFSGFPEQNGTWGPYWNGLFQEVSCVEMEAGRGRHDKVKTDVIIPNNGSEKDCSPIHLLSWSPFNPKLFYLADREVSVTSALGKAEESPEATLLAGLYDAKMEAAKKNSHINRCVAFLREINEGITKGFSIGTGQAAGMAISPGANNPTAALATGGLLGKNTTRQDNLPEFRIACLNDGPLDPPQLPKSKDSPGAETPAAPAPPQPESKAPPTQTIRIEVVTVPSAQTSIPVTPTTLASTPATTATAPLASCDLPAFVVDFGFNESNVKDEYRATIKSKAIWLENHPDCKVQVEGHASTEGSFAFNAALARNRAKAVYDILAEDRNIQGQLVQFVSLSKDRASSERNPADRRVILRVVGNASGR
jgi:outer membrane protein OmpA-like peptidoglycan-associated protein